MAPRGSRIHLVLALLTVLVVYPARCAASGSMDTTPLEGAATAESAAGPAALRKRGIGWGLHGAAQVQALRGMTWW